MHKFFALILLFPLTLSAQQAPEMQEWEATLVNGPNKLTLRLLARMNNGKWDAVIQQVQPAGADVKVDTFAIVGDIVRFEITDGFLASFTGKMNAEKGELVGTWRDGEKGFPLTFKRKAIQQVVESWAGTLEGSPQPTELQFRVLEESAGIQIAKFDSLSEKLMGLNALVIRGKDRKLIFSIPAISARFEGTVDATGDSATGTWTQGQKKVPLILKRTVVADAPVVKADSGPSRPQTPTPPFRYEIEEVTFTNEADKVTLAGTLTRPRGDKKSVAVVLISALGPQDRDQTIFGHKPFFLIADELTKSGIAVLRFDDRGIGGSTGDFNSATTTDSANDVRAAVAFLRKHPAINANQIGLIGHSEGASIAPMVAATDSNLGFIVLMAGAGVNGFEILKDQSRRLSEAEGLPAELIESESALQNAIASAVRSAPESADGNQVVGSAVNQYLARFAPSEQAQMRPSPEQMEAYKQLGTPAFRQFLKYEPSTALRRVKCPVLAINGERDLQVWHETNLPAIVAALKAGGNTKFRAVRFPALNHLFQRAKTGAVSEYDQIEQTIAPEVLTLLENWIKKTTGSR